MIYIIEESIDKMGGVERIVSTLSNSFADRNHDVTVISFYKSSDKPFFSYNKNVKREYLVENAKDCKIKNKLNYFRLIKKWKIISKNIKNDDTIIFGRVSVAAKILPIIKNNPNIIVRDAINIYNHSRFVKIVMKVFFPKKVSTFIVSSDESLKIYDNFFKGNFKRIKKIYNPLSIDVSKIKKYSYENKVIISTGRFDKQKGFENLIYAFENVSKKFPDWKLKIVGDGKLRENYLRIIEDHKINNIEIAPSSTKIEDELNNASIYVMTSRYEGYANALVEAVAFGLPSISYDWLTGVEEIISNEKNGLIVKLTNRKKYHDGIDNQIDITNLSNAIIKLISDKETCLNMSKYHKQVLENRNKEKIISEWEKLITNHFGKERI